MSEIGIRKGLLLTEFNPITKARIKGYVPKNATRFDINVRNDPLKPDTLIPLHLALLVKPGKMCVNFYKSGWSSYCTEFPNLPIKPGCEFEVVIHCKYDYYKISIDGEYFCSFKHHLSTDITTAIEARGEVSISTIVVEGF